MNLSTRWLSALVALAAVAQGFYAPRSVAAEQPNVVFILADDLGREDCGFMGGKEIKTPHLDKLAAAGAKLDAFYVQPVCSPTRAALMTGRYPMRHGLQVGVVRPWAQYGLPLEERTLAAGAEGGGLRHRDRRQVAPRPLRPGVPADAPRLRPPVRPLQRRARLLHPHPRRRLRLAQGRQGLPRRGLQPRTCSRRRRSQFVDRHTPARSRSSCTCRSTPSTRRTRCRTEYMKPYADLKGERRSYAGMLAAMDEAVGQIVEAVEKAGVRKNTLFIFSSDNGGPQPGVVTDNGKYRAGKGTLYEGGVRVAAFATWDGHIKAGQHRHRAAAHGGLVPDAAEAVRREGSSRSCRSTACDIWPTLTQGKPSPHDAILLNTTPNGGAVRAGDWKLVVQNRRRRPGRRPAEEEGRGKDGGRAVQPEGRPVREDEPRGEAPGQGEGAAGQARRVREAGGAAEGEAEARGLRDAEGLGREGLDCSHHAPS